MTRGPAGRAWPTWTQGAELHPATLLLAFAFGGILGGDDMFPGVAIIVMLRIVLTEFETTRPQAELLSDRLAGR